MAHGSSEEATLIPLAQSHLQGGSRTSLKRSGAHRGGPALPGRPSPRAVIFAILSHPIGVNVPHAYKAVNIYRYAGGKGAPRDPARGPSRLWPITPVARVLTLPTPDLGSPGDPAAPSVSRRSHSLLFPTTRRPWLIPQIPETCPGDTRSRRTGRSLGGLRTRWGGGGEAHAPSSCQCRAWAVGPLRLSQESSRVLVDHSSTVPGIPCARRGSPSARLTQSSIFRTAGICQDLRDLFLMVPGCCHQAATSEDWSQEPAS